MNRTIIYSIIAALTLFFASLPLSSQSKPKRDVTRDKTTAKTQVAQPVKASAPEKVHAVKKKPKSTIAFKPAQPKPELNLKVNQQKELTFNANYFGEVRQFDVDANGYKWSVCDSLPEWCNFFSQNAASFTLTVDANSNHEQREGDFYVQCEQQKVLVHVIQSQKPISITAQFKDIEVYHNLERSCYRKDDNKCLQIETDLTLTGAKGLNCFVVADIVDEYGNKITCNREFYQYNPKCSVIERRGCFVGATVCPSSDLPTSYRLGIEIPNNLLKLTNSENNMRITLRVICDKTDAFALGESEVFNVKAKSKKGKITTK